MSEPKKYYVAVIELDNRKEQAIRVQEVLTEYGHCILTRQGIHNPDNDRGIITLNVKADDSCIKEFSDKLSAIDGVKVKVVDTE